MRTSNEYAELLRFLENEDKRDVGLISPKPKSKTKPKGDTKKLDISIKTKQLIEESKDIHADVPQDVSMKGRSLGFDITKFESLMRTRLIDEYKKTQSYERPYISVGELITCLRSNYYSRQRYPVDVKVQFSFAYLYLIRRVGNEVHSVVQDLYDFAETEKTVVSEKFKVKGRVDAIKSEFLYEIKTLEKLPGGTYNKDHYYQGIIYARILNTEYNYNIKTITILYFPRNLKNVIPFDLPMNDELAVSFLKRASVLQSSLVSKHVPEPVGATEESCRYCLYKKFCERDKCETIQPFKKSKNGEKNGKSVFLLS